MFLEISLVPAISSVFTPLVYFYVLFCEREYYNKASPNNKVNM